MPCLVKLAGSRLPIGKAGISGAGTQCLVVHTLHFHDSEIRMLGSGLIMDLVLSLYGHGQETSNPI